MLAWPVVCFGWRYIPSMAVLAWFLARSSRSFEDLYDVMTPTKQGACDGCASVLFTMTVIVSFGFKPAVRTTATIDSIYAIC